RILAVLLVLLGLLAAVAGIIAAVISQFVSQLPALADSVGRSVQQLQPLVNRVPGLTGGASWQELAQRWGGLGGGSALRTAVGYTSSVVEFLGGLLLLLIALFVYLWDGQRLARGALRVLPRRHRRSAAELGDQLWRTLGDFFRAQTTVALVDAVLIGAGLALLGVPLVIPLAVVVFLGAFFPYVGATVSGLLAVVVAFADGGPGSAVAVLALVLGVQILEGNLIEPYIAGRMVRVRPFAVIVAVGVGGTLLGVLGAFLAVPAAACLARVVTFLQRDEDAGSGSSAATPMHNPAHV
ncbi:MAG: AI-2E family transporter, partial [Pseudonocardiaceae bacterium]